MADDPLERRRPAHILPIIVFAQFAGTSLWFAGNAVLGDLAQAPGWDLGGDALGLVTSAVQLGFIAGTLVFAVLNVADRFPPRAVFLACALLGALANAGIMVMPEGLVSLLTLRFATGFFLAGIYPVGMKIAAGWYASGLGHALGLLVGALVLGTAFPHLLKAGGGALPWRTVLVAVSATAAAGGLILFAFVPSGPYLPRRSAFDPSALRKIFRAPEFRAAAFGYFGHMWELYAFWTVVPLLVGAIAVEHGAVLDVPLWSFAIIAAGAVGCAAGGWISQRRGSAPVAAAQLAVSGALCLVAPLLLELPVPLALALLVVWGLTVVGDSPQLSALNAQTAPRELVGTALTITTSIGFALTIPSIQLLTWLTDQVSPTMALLVLVPGPALGLLALRRLLRVT